MRYNSKVGIIIIMVSLLVPLHVDLSHGLEPLDQIISRGGSRSTGLNLSEVSWASFIGEGGEDHAGYSVACGGDINEDGYNDILIGAPGNDELATRAGQTYMLFGNDLGFSQNMDLASSDASFFGSSTSSQAGRYVCSAGDVNGDGFDDFLIGAPDDPTVAIQAGKVYLYLGKSSGWGMDTSDSTATTRFLGETNNQFIGYSLSGGGDVNGDGYDDFLIGSLSAISNNAKAYLFFGKESGWPSTITISDADVTFSPEISDDYLGRAVCIAGDLNDDGLDDMVLGANGNDEGGNYAGQTYIIFGRTSGWSSTFGVSDADASFIGEDADDRSGRWVARAGDVNGDGFDDFLIGAPWDDDNEIEAGQTYLILGKSIGWSMDTDLSNADASFLGESAGDRSGSVISCAGDFNGDGYDDFMIGAPLNSENGAGAGKVYMIFGRETEWQSNTQLSSADISFVGEYSGDHAGNSLADVGDVNNDGSDDIMIGAYYNHDNGYQSGKVYLVSDKGYREPYEIYNINVMNGIGTETYLADKEEMVQVEMTGLDCNATLINRARVNITFTKTKPNRVTITLLETGLNTGVYRGSFIIPKRTEYLEKVRFSAYINQSKYKDMVVDYPFRPISITSIGVYSSLSSISTVDKLDIGQNGHFKCTGLDSNPVTVDRAFVNLTSNKNSTYMPLIVLTETGQSTGIYTASFTVPSTMEYFENITATSVRDPTKSNKFMVHTPVQIRPFVDNKTAYEDIEYREQYWNFGWDTNPTWTLTTDKDWVYFDQGTKELYGTPNNIHIGLTQVELNLTDTEGHFSSHFFRIIVENSVPNLMGTDIIEIDQGEYYETDYDCNDDGQGNVTYFLSSNAEWLTIDSLSGILNGTPTNDDVGTVTVTVSVHDGNEGWDSRQFDIKVINVNDPPIIITNDTLSVYQNDPFLKNYQALEIDSGDEIKWKLHTDAGFLSIDYEMGTLSGNPGPMDVGSYFVNVSVWDLSDEFDFHNFTLEVLNVNDGPAWVDFPEDVDIIHGKTYLFDVNATDYDGDIISYSISSTPASDITIDEDTGQINWTANIHVFDEAPFKLEVIVSAWDGLAFTNRTFTITVLASLPPEVELIGPADGAKGASTGAILSWEGTDPEGESITYDIYLHQTEVFVQGYREEAIYEEEYDGTNITLSDLDPGKTYFWTVIPNDGCSNGLCTSGVMSFRVNYKPTFKIIEDQKISAGTNFKFKISCTDQDMEDLPNLRYSLVDAPDGMTISDETGMIRWTPKDNQVMLHTVTVEVSDGIETNTVTFEIEVGEAESSSSSLFLIIIIVVVVVILLALGIFFFMKKKKQMDEEAIKRGEEERAALEKEREDNTPSYEDLYGVPAPEKDEEGLTTSELKDYIHEQIEDLEEHE